jgi:carboxypeptidase T
VKIKIALLLLFGGLLGPNGLIPAETPSNAGLVSVPKNLVTSRKIESLGLDVLAEWQGKFFVLAGPEDLERLEAEQIVYRPETTAGPAYPASQTRGGINGAYHTYLELQADLFALERSHPDIAKIFDIGDSHEKRHIYALKISDNVALEEEEAEILFTGCHHAREWISVEVPFLLGKYLVENYATDPEVKRLVDRSEIWIVPLVNPDGLEYSIHVYRYWRKNRRDSGHGNFGVDLNRNYGYQWGLDDEGSSPDPGSSVYRGPAPFSEPETQAVRDLFLRKNFRAMISYHSFSQVILYPWGYTVQTSDRNEEMRTIAAEMSRRIQAVNGRTYAYGQSSGPSMYLTNGDTTDWTFGIAGIPSYTIELPPIDELSGGFFNRQEDIDPIFTENLPAALYLVDRSIQEFRPRPPSRFDLRSLFFIKD